MNTWQKKILDDGSHRCVQGPARRQGGRSRVSQERVGSEELFEGQAMLALTAYWKNVAECNGSARRFSAEDMI